MQFHHIMTYELKKFFKTARGYILLLTGTVPLILFLSLSAEKSRLEYLVTGNMSIIQNALLIAYIFYTYILTIFFTIMVFSDILTNEKAYEFILVSASRTTILGSKVLTAIFLNVILILETLFSFVLTMISYNLPLPDSNIVMRAVIVSLLICVLLVIPIILFSNTLIIKIAGPFSSMANYLAIFIFFVIPFIIYFSLFELSLFQPEILNYSIHTFVQSIIYSTILTSNSTVDSVQFSNNIVNLSAIGLAGYSISFILFRTSSIIT